MKCYYCKENKEEFSICGRWFLTTNNCHGDQVKAHLGCYIRANEKRILLGYWANSRGPAMTPKQWVKIMEDEEIENQIGLLEESLALLKKRRGKIVWQN